MPTRLYRPDAVVRYSALDRLTAHEWSSTIVAGVWTAIGGLLCWLWVYPGGGPTTVLSQMSVWHAGSVAVALLVCGIALLTSIVWPGKDATAWRIELSALPLGATAWASYAVVSPSIFWQIVAAGYVAGSALRFRAAWRGFHRPHQQVVVLIHD